MPSEPKVMVVDDDALITDTLAEFFFVELDFEPLTFTDPRDAAAHLRAHEVDVIISDMLMPEMDGIELLGIARDAQPDVPRIVLTGYADKDRALAAINEVGVFQFVEKPWQPERLRQTVVNALDKRQLVRRLAEEQAKLVQAEKMASVGFFAAGVAHEINNPLAGVMACLDALQNKQMAPERREQYFATARDGLERMHSIVRDLLDYARQRPPAPSALDAASVLQSCLNLLAPAVRAAKVEVVVELGEGDVELRADRSQLMQVLINVLTNAVHAAPAGGRVTVSAPLAGGDGGGDNGDAGDGRVALVVADNGAGMSAETLARATEPFFTTKPEGEGSGLGLAVSAGLLEANGGVLEIASVEGEGTRVSLRLPRA
ncbi:MAG: response regulator [Myxococcales bacterium]|nr:response regulator [Myxococcales bacterium]